MDTSTYARMHRQRIRLVRRAERETGFKEGKYTLDGQLYKVEVTFYGGEAWWLTPLLASGDRRKGTKSKVLTKQLFQRLKPA